MDDRRQSRHCHQFPAFAALRQAVLCLTRKSISDAEDRKRIKNSSQSMHTSELLSAGLRCLISDSMSQVTADFVVRE